MRTRGKKLTKAETEDKTNEAIELSARGKSDSEISRELEVDRRTVKRLIDNGLAARAEHRANDVERHLSVYDRVQREAWTLYDSCPDERAQNKVGALNAVIAAEQAKVKLTGAEAPKRNEHSGPGGGPIPHGHKLDLTKITAEELDFFERILDTASGSDSGEHPG